MWKNKQQMSLQASLINKILQLFKGDILPEYLQAQHLEAYKHYSCW